MSKLKFLIPLIFLISVSCNKKETADLLDAIPPHSFKNQNLSGKAAGKDWNFKLGRVMCNPPVLCFIRLFDSTIDQDTCATIGNFEILTEVPYPIKPGLYAVRPERRSFTTTDSATVVKGFVGALEIISVNESSTLVTGRMDVRKDDQWNYNGNFTIKICPN